MILQVGGYVGERETFVLPPATVRVVLVSAGLVFCSAVFLAMTANCAMIKVDSAIARFALMLAGLVAYLLLLLRTNIIRIELTPLRPKLRLPRVGGPLRLLGTIRADIPYTDIASVDTREEVYISFGLAIVQHAYSIVTRDGVRVLLGVMTEN